MNWDLVQAIFIGSVVLIEIEECTKPSVLSAFQPYYISENIAKTDLWFVLKEFPLNKQVFNIGH